jgi:hypothetical protein
MKIVNPLVWTCLSVLCTGMLSTALAESIPLAIERANIATSVNACDIEISEVCKEIDPSDINAIKQCIVERKDGLSAECNRLVDSNLRTELLRKVPLPRLTANDTLKELN